MTFIQLSENVCFGGQHKRYSHASFVNNCQMTFAVFLPPQVKEGKKVPVLYWLSGLTCTDENFMQKAGALRVASELGLAIVAPDTSPRGDGIPDDPDGDWDFGLGAGFYVNATKTPWSENYRMYDYVTQELPALIQQNFPVLDKKSIAGHSMGGHGALISVLKNPEYYQSVSAFAPIANPTSCPWGKKAFSNYLGEDRKAWVAYDACELVEHTQLHIPMLIDQGDQDPFLSEQLGFQTLSALLRDSDWPVELNLREGYDHSFFFISSFIENHLRFHAKYLL